MSVRKYLIKLNNKLESSWKSIDFDQPKIELEEGWHIIEFMISGSLDHIPRLVVQNTRGNTIERSLLGSHPGRNRLLIYIPAGRLTAVSSALEIERLARVSVLEGRARVLLICVRYLWDFLGLKALAKVIMMQFQDPLELSDRLLTFYEPAAGKQGYLDNLSTWNKLRGFDRTLNWLGRGVKIAVVIEDRAQETALADLLMPPDFIVMAGDPVPDAADYCLPLSVSERLQEPAIIMLKRAIRARKPRPHFVYTDHDYGLDPDSELHPVFKPSPSRAYLHCFNYVGFSVLVARKIAKHVGTSALMSDSTRYALALEAFEQVDYVQHIDEVLISSARTEEMHTPVPQSPTSPWPNIEWQARSGYNALVAASNFTTGPSVDLVIPTRDGLAVLQPCIDSILSKTTYNNFKVIVVDNGSEKAETLAYFDKIKQDERVSIVAYPGEFNYSAINNFAVATGSSEFVALVNNDIEVIEGDWLTQMMAWATQEKVGIVGAKLLFGNGRVQHAGVTIGMGNAAGHIHRLEEGDAPGYQLRCLATQNMMAVTAACLVTPRALFEELGGLDETNFKVAYNDIDYCLRVESRGYEIIWTPEAILYHHESVSRGNDLSDVHVERYLSELGALQARWKCKGFVDKYYSKHLRISDEGVYPLIERAHAGELRYL